MCTVGPPPRVQPPFSNTTVSITFREVDHACRWKSDGHTRPWRRAVATFSKRRPSLYSVCILSRSHWRSSGFTVEQNLGVDTEDDTRATWTCLRGCTPLCFAVAESSGSTCLTVDSKTRRVHHLRAAYERSGGAKLGGDGRAWCGSVCVQARGKREPGTRGGLRLWH